MTHRGRYADAPSSRTRVTEPGRVETLAGYIRSMASPALVPSKGRHGLARAFARRGASAFGRIVTAIRTRRKVFWGVAAGVFAFDLVAPVVILSVARKRMDFFTFNPWLSRLPEYLASEAPFAKKLAFVSHMAIAWFSSDNPVEGLEWGFVIDVPSLARVLLMSLVFGAYFSVWSQRRLELRACGRGLGAARPAGVAGVATSALGLTTGPCSVAGCGVPVLPVVGLAFTGISSGTLAFFTILARVSFVVVLLVMSLAVVWVGWRAGTTPIEGPLRPS